MTSDKLVKLVQLLVEREVERLVPAIKRQLIQEMKQTKSNSLRVSGDDVLKSYNKTKQQRQQPVYSSNSMLNELISSAKSPIEFDVPEDLLSEIRQTSRPKQQPTKQRPVSHTEMLSTMVRNPEGQINVQNENVKNTLDIINRDYSSIVKKIQQPVNRDIAASLDITGGNEDLSWLNDIE